jgi:hypothetical protein
MSELEELKQETIELKQPQVKLYAILARESSKAVIFRRGPTRIVGLHEEKGPWYV